MADRRESITTEVKGADKGARDLKKLGDAADDTAGDFVQLGKSMVPYVKGAKQAEKATDDLGDELDHTAHDAAHLTREIERLTKAQKELGAEFARSGNKDAFKMSGQVGRNISQLKQLQKMLAPTPGPPGAPPGGIGRGVLDMFGSAGGKLGPGGGAAAVAALSALPFLGAATGAVGLLGAGLGAMGGGVALTASRNDDVQASFAGMAGRASGRLGVSADAAFAKPLIQAAKTLDDTFDNVADDLDRIFAKSSKFVDPLTKGLAGLVQNVLPGFEKGLDGAADLVDTLGDHLPKLGDAIGDMFGSFSDGSEGANQALDDLLTGTAGLIRGIGEVVEGLSDFYDASVKLRNINPILRNLFGDDFVSEVGEIGSAGDDALDQIEGAATRAAKEVGALNDQFDRLFGRMMDTDEAAIKYQAAIDALTSSFKENGKSIDINTDKGRTNREAILDVIGAIEAQRQAAIDAGDGSKDATERANAAYQAQMAELRTQLTLLGLTATQIDALILKYQDLAKPLTKTIHVNIIENYTGAGGSGGQATTRGGARAMAKGGLISAASGVVAPGFYRGGSPLVQFAERSTGIEAYIPQRGISHSRGLELADAAARMHGGQVVAGGGMGALEMVVNGAADSLMYQAMMHGVRVGAIQLYADKKRVVVR